MSDQISSTDIYLAADSDNPDANPDASLSTDANVNVNAVDSALGSETALPSAEESVGEINVKDLSDIDEFLGRISGLPDGLADLTPALEPSLVAERNLRRAFAANPDHHYLRENITIGLLDVFDAPPDVRKTRSRLPSQFPAISSDDFARLCVNGPNGSDEQYIAECLFSKHVLVLDPSARRAEGAPSTVEDLGEFIQNWGFFTSGILDHLNWDNVVAAGGSVLACLQSNGEAATNRGCLFHETPPYSRSDIDLFLWGLDEDQACLKMIDIFVSIKSSIPQWDVVCVRKKHTVTIYSRFPFKPIQIVLRLYHSPAEILAGFDVDSSCFIFDGNRVYSNPRGIVSLMRQANTVDVSRRSPSYEIRLDKYASRGFEVFVTDLDRSRVKRAIYTPRLHSFPSGLARLLVLERIRQTNGMHYRSLQCPEPKLVGKKTMQAQKAMVDALETTGYDSALIYIPYGPGWDARKIRELAMKISVTVQTVDGATIDDEGHELYSANENPPHFHSLFVADTMSDCLNDMCSAEVCPEPPAALAREKYIRGPLTFITIDPGRQLLSGSFNPIDNAEWAKEAY